MFKSSNNKNKVGLASTTFASLGKSSAGFTLIEATIAIFILVIGLTSVIQFFPFSLKIIGDSQHLTTASNLALAKIEEVRSMTYDNLTVGTIETKHRLSSNPASYLYDYQRETVVETIDSDFNTNATDVGLKKVTVNIFWRSAIGKVEKITQMNALVTNY